jgi:hypothetical protein
VGSYEYLTPTGTKADKRKWPIGTPVSATLTGGSVVKGMTASVPRQFGGGGWGVRLHGVSYVLPLERVDARYQVGLLEIPSREAFGNDKES